MEMLRVESVGFFGGVGPFSEPQLRSPEANNATKQLECVEGAGIVGADSHLELNGTIIEQMTLIAASPSPPPEKTNIMIISRPL